MMKKLSDFEDYIMVSDVDGLEPRSYSECNVVSRLGKIEKTTERQLMPFVCKVAASDAPYDKECGVYSNDYTSKMSVTGSCYRISRIEATWNEANAKCQTEGAHLVILNNEQELETLNNLFQDKGYDLEKQYFAGVRADKASEPRVFKTVLNQTLEEVGYAPWEDKEPNDYEGAENCVVLDTRRHGKYNDVWCNVRMPYVCESSGEPLVINVTPSTSENVPTETVPLKQYRPDYEYNKDTDTFYKLHTEHSDKNSAYDKCVAEGAELAQISSDEDMKQILTMMKKHPDLKDNSVWFATSDVFDFSKQIEYYEGMVLGSDGNYETKNVLHTLSFVCKVAAKDVPYNEECNVYAKGYESKVSTTGSCYRVSTVEATWDEAQATCQAEGAHLVILSNDEELDILFNMLKEKPHNSETQYFAGVKTESTTEPRVFKTVFNQTLEEVGYGPWDETEPNDYKGGENCVALDTRRHGKYNDVWCNVKMPYVCEIKYTAPVPSKQYRPDYEYNKNTDAFYKLHTTGTFKSYAHGKCEKEGAELVKIATEGDVKQILSMMEKLSVLEDYVMVASGEDSDSYSSTDKINVMNRRGKMEKTTSRQELPFVCKVAAKDAPYNKECGVYSNDYESRISTTGSCYRVSTAEATWSEAYANCKADGAHLVILSNDEELEVLYNMLQEKPHNSETQYFAGVRADTTSEPRVFKTVLNETLEEVGYGPWDENEPNDYEGGENCVVLDTRRHGKYNDVWCHVAMPYVCEKESSVSSKYRLDYEYNKNTNAFYKLHADHSIVYYASETCKAEGAELVKIRSDGDLRQIQSMMKKLPDYEDLVTVASQDITEDSDYRWIDEINVVNRGGKFGNTTSSQELPFVCKVASKDAPYNKECGVYSNEYESRISTTGSCYGVSTSKATWNEAYAKCQAEGAHLVILDSEKELEVLYKILNTEPYYSDTQFYVGVRADTTTEPRVFKTVLNQTLEEVGYEPWDENEPSKDGAGENCVTLNTRGRAKYKNVRCHLRMSYVCESSGTPLEISTTPSTPIIEPDVPVSSKKYQAGYQYNENTDAFYKLHTRGAYIHYAKYRCKKEYAELLNISSDEDVKQVLSMMKKLSILEDYVMIAPDAYFDEYSRNQEYKVLNRRGKIEKTTAFQQLPFVCKVAAKDAPYNEECGVYSNDYESRITTTGSCYRVSKIYGTWSEASDSCQKEGAHLVILSNDEELKVLQNMLQEKSHNSVTQYFAGVRADTTSEPRVFRTVLNQTLEEVGYGPWDENEPNDYEGGENCVALDTRRHGKYNDVWCHVRMLYVCEKSITPATIKRYRPDYEYNKNTDAFYKLHVDGTVESVAPLLCKNEYANVVQITSDEDLKQIMSMMERLPEFEELVMIASPEETTSFHQNSKSTVVNRRGKIGTTGSNQELPFVCKVAAKDVPYNKECGLYSHDYVSRSSTGSCYRVSKDDDTTWSEAQARCQAEGAHLVILDSDIELETVNDILKDQMNSPYTQYYAGVRADTTTEPRVFKTVLNQTLYEGPWEENEPNEYESGENCVALDTRRHGKYNNVWCHINLPYVCELSGAPLDIVTILNTPIIEPTKPVAAKQYRPDYEYNKKTDAFYKLHAESSSEFHAYEKCKTEGADFVKITSDEDLKQIHSMMKKLSDLEDLVMVASSERPGPYRWNTKCNVVNRWGKNETTTCRQELPFVCKVAAKDAPYNQECGVYSNDYESRISTTGSCYKVSTVDATWNEAHASCQADGAHLVILSSDEELNVLYNILKERPHDSETQYFAGVRADTTSEQRVFKTVQNQTLEEVGYGPWDENEPNDYEGGENCVALDMRRHGKYNDVWCHVRMPYVCESSGPQVKISATPNTRDSVAGESASSKQYIPGYEYNKNTDAFYKLHKVGFSKSGSSSTCENEGAELAQITSDEDIKQILAMFKNLPDQEYVMVGCEGNDCSSNNEYNLMNHKGKIEKGIVNQVLPFVCKVAASDVIYSKECGVYSEEYESKISITGSCYKISEAEATWKEAYADCKSEGAHLVILNNDEELNVLVNMLKHLQHSSITQYFAGVRADTTTEPRVFKTVLNQTLEEVGYGPWDENEPNDYEGGENCVALDTRRHGKYNDVWCHVRMPYICESYPAPVKVVTTASTPSNDYDISIAGSSYKVHTSEATWAAAHAICQSEGAHLVILNSDEELKALYNVLQEKPHGPETQYFAGVTVDPSTQPRTFRTVFNQTLQEVGYGPWDENEPNDYHGGENCVALDTRRHGKYNDVWCYVRMPFVCEKSGAPVEIKTTPSAPLKDYDISIAGSSYKVHTSEATWADAHATCQSEGAHLVILNSDEELKALYNVLQEKPHGPETQYFAGVTADPSTQPRTFRTVFNQTLQEVGYGPWDENEPNDYEGGENCVALDTRRHGKYNDVWCHVRMPFVCEKSGTPVEIKITSSTPRNEPAVQVPSKQYRPDYEYNTNTDAFYKLHTKAATRYYASDKCRSEGAEVVKITSQDDLKQVHVMLKRLSDLEDLVMVDSNDDVDSPQYNGNVVNRRGKIEKTTNRQELPFICKVAAKDAPYNEECGVYSNDYESRISTTGSCYRISTAEATWKEAYEKCQEEGAYLVVLSNDKELEVLYNMLKDKPHHSETQYFAGVRVDATTEPRTFKTVLNQTLEEVGYGPWDENEPNDYEGGEYCVALDTRRHGKYNDVWCHVKMPYVCESYGDPTTMIDQRMSSVSPDDPEPVPSPVPAKQYRSDYEYNGKTDAFYKLHSEGARKRPAIAKCTEEGAELLKITSEEDLKQVRAMMKKFPDLTDPVIVASIDATEQMDLDYNYNVLNREGEVKVATAHQQLPFVCKIAAKDVPYNKECDVYSIDYVSRILITGSCYRVFLTEATWEHAHANCQAQGAHLVILNSDKELEALYAMLLDKPHNSGTQYFAGVTEKEAGGPRVFKTVLNQTLEEVGYGPWEESEPNDYHGGEHCVALDTRRHGKYNDVWCHVKMPYVCEKTPTEIQSSTKSPDIARMQRGLAMTANIMRTFNFFFGPFGS